MLRLSPGIAQGCHELLLLIKKHQQPPPQLLQAFAHFSSIPSVKIFSTAQALDWVRVDEQGIVVPTVAGDRLLSHFSYASLLRQMLLDYIDIERPSWLQNAISGRAKVLAFAGAEIGQVFVEADLADAITDDVVSFWDSIAARARGQRDASLMQVGRQGERLSLAFEEYRTRRKARWVSIESNEDGYDILSVVDKEDFRKLSIEVKATKIGLNGAFFLTVNEWERAQEAPQHQFHLWDLSAAVTRLCIVSAPQMEVHVSCNRGQGDWQSLRVPFLAFREHFCEIPTPANY